MKAIKQGRKARQMKTRLSNVMRHAFETFWVIAANATVGLVTLPIHRKGARRTVERLSAVSPL